MRIALPPPAGPRPAAPPSGTPAALAPPLRRWSVDVGLPHLGPAGLAEAWALRECGHVHWGLLGDVLGAPAPAWRTADGDRVYASFVATSLTGPAHARLQEGDTLRVTSRLVRAGPGAYLSLHALERAGHPGASELELLSVFSALTDDDGARGFRLATPTARPVRPAPERQTPLLDYHRRYRRPLGPAAFEATSEVNPPDDFNHVGLVYFANYGRYVGRVEHAAFRDRPEAAWPVESRQTYLYRNAGPDGRITARLVPVAASPAAAVYAVHLVRGDGALMATCVARRAAPAPSGDGAATPHPPEPRP